MQKMQKMRKMQKMQKAENTVFLHDIEHDELPAIRCRDLEERHERIREILEIDILIDDIAFPDVFEEMASKEDIDIVCEHE